MTPAIEERVALAACPFCPNGQRAELFRSTAPAFYWYAGCIKCDCEGPPCVTKDGAAKAWNRRSPAVAPTTEPGLVEALEAGANAIDNWRLRAISGGFPNLHDGATAERAELLRLHAAKLRGER